MLACGRRALLLLANLRMVLPPGAGRKRQAIAGARGRGGQRRPWRYDGSPAARGLADDRSDGPQGNKPMSDSVEIRRLTSGGIVVGRALKGYDGLLTGSTGRPRGGGERNASGCE